MSTPALISVKTDYGYATAWVNFNGMPSELGAVLKSKVYTKVHAGALVTIGTISAIMTPKAFKDFQQNYGKMNNKTYNVLDVPVGEYYLDDKKALNNYDFIHFTEPKRQGFYVYRNTDLRRTKLYGNDMQVFPTLEALKKNWKKAFNLLGCHYIYVYENDNWTWFKP